MRSSRLTLLSAFALAMSLGAASAAQPAPRGQTLFFDAIYTRARTAGPDANHVGHEQIASGVLRDAGGRNVGRFAFTCTWTRILAVGDALERCAGTGTTADDQVTVAGPARESDMTHTWRITNGTGAYHGARGTLLVRDLGPAETVITATVTPRRGVALRAGAIDRPAADTTFLAHANHICAQASRQLTALPPFPYPNFDPLRPDPALLPQVGAFFAGPGDPRPIFRTLYTQLRALGAPPANRSAWGRTLRARAAALTVINEQDAAALAANTPAFVNTVHASDRAYRQVAITATVFGAIRCVL